MLEKNSGIRALVRFDLSYVKGSIIAGKLADFVTLKKSPYDVDPDAIKEIQVVRTVVGGADGLRGLSRTSQFLLTTQKAHPRFGVRVKTL